MLVVAVLMVRDKLVAGMVGEDGVVGGRTGDGQMKRMQQNESRWNRKLPDAGQTRSVIFLSSN